MKMSWKCTASTSNIAFSTLFKSHFGLVKVQEMSSQCLETTWNFAFSTWAKSQFGLVMRQKKSWKGNASSWNIAISNLLNRILAGQEAGKELTLPGDQLKLRFLDLTQIAIRAGQETENQLKLQCGTCNIVSRTHTSRIFVWSEVQEFSSKYHGNYWNITFSNTP